MSELRSEIMFGPNESLIEEVNAESQLVGDWKIQFELDLSAAISLCGNLQLALRHPSNNGPAADTARQLINDIRTGIQERGLTAHAKLIALGDDPANDTKIPMTARDARRIIRRLSPD
jgi:hypothetical protein